MNGQLLKMTIRLTILLCALLLPVACGRSSGPAAATAVLPVSSPAASGGVSAPAQPTPVPPPATAATGDGRIPASDPLIRYTGRFDFSDPARPRFDWPAVQIEAAFSGTAVAALLDDGLNAYDVSIDGGAPFTLQTRAGQERYALAEGLAEGRHTVRLTKRTETFYGTPAFLGLELDPGAALLPLPDPPARRLEFIGDSITAGYGVEGTSPTCVFSPQTENAALTYAAQTAEALGAAYHVAAVSGLGVVRNYNSDGSLSPGTMLAYYGRTLANEEAEDWDFAAWVPDGVVINLGTNDFSTTPHPAGELFLNGYTNLIFKVRARYPEAHIFAVAGPLMVGPAEDTIRSVVAQMNQVLGDARVHYVPIANTLELTAVDFGCDWHPNANGQAKIAAQLAPAIAGVLGW